MSSASHIFPSGRQSVQSVTKHHAALFATGFQSVSKDWGVLWPASPSVTPDLSTTCAATTNVHQFQRVVCSVLSALAMHMNLAPGSCLKSEKWRLIISYVKLSKFFRWGEMFELFAFSSVSTGSPELEAVMHHVKISATCDSFSLRNYSRLAKRGISTTGKLFWHLSILIWICTDRKDFGWACQVNSSSKLKKSRWFICWDAIGETLGGHTWRTRQPKKDTYINPLQYTGDWFT